VRQRALSASIGPCYSTPGPPWRFPRAEQPAAMLRSIDAATPSDALVGAVSPGRQRSRLNAVDSHIYGFTLQEINFPIEAQTTAAMASSFPAPAIPRSFSPLDALPPVIEWPLTTGFMPSASDLSFHP